MILIDGSNLSIEDVVAVARNGEEVRLTANAIKAIQRSQNWVKDIIERGDPGMQRSLKILFFADRH